MTRTLKTSRLGTDDTRGEYNYFKVYCLLLLSIYQDLSYIFMHFMITIISVYSHLSWVFPSWVTRPYTGPERPPNTPLQELVIAPEITL